MTTSDHTVTSYFTVVATFNIPLPIVTCSKMEKKTFIDCVYCFLQPSQFPVQGFFAAIVSVFLSLTTVIALETALMAVMRLDVVSY